MSLLKVNNPRSLLIKAETKDSNKKIVTIKSPQNEQKKIVIDVVKPQPEPKIIKVEAQLHQPTTTNIKSQIKLENTSENHHFHSHQQDVDLQMPSELLKCQFKEEKDNNDIIDIPGEFYFETDHEVLRNNTDYHNLLKTLAILQAQKIQAVKDIENLIQCKQLAAKNPSNFLSEFNEKFAKLPNKQNVPKVPDIDWDKYKIPSISHVIQKPETRFKGEKSVILSRKDELLAKEKVEGILDCKVERNAKGQYLIRGRIFDQSKPQTFNQPWTPEEQRRLEELLVEYPSEEIEMDRWKKIATCLGNRTSVQVQSRVQKYFQKLQKAGLPVPGKYKRNTNSSNIGLARPKRPSLRTKYANSLIGSRNSSFFPDMKPHVKMTDEDEREADESIWSMDSSGSGFCWSDSTNDKPTKYRLMETNKYYVVEEDVSDEEDIDTKQYESPGYQRLKWLKRIRREKEFELREGSSSNNAMSLFVHSGYKCDGCGQDPIRGGRFTCLECLDDGDALENNSVDFCLDCAPKGLILDDKPEHTQKHLLKPVRKKMTELPSSTADKDYLCLTQNYLDPNFVN